MENNLKNIFILFIECKVILVCIYLFFVFVLNMCDVMLCELLLIWMVRVVRFGFLVFLFDMKWFFERMIKKIS